MYSQRLFSEIYLYGLYSVNESRLDDDMVNVVLVLRPVEKHCHIAYMLIVIGKTDMEYI